MKLIDKYILREYLVPLFYSLGAFCLMYVILDLFDRFPDLMEARVSVLEGLVFYGYYLFAVNGFVPFIVVVLPIVLLLSALYTLTLFARHNELTAMCASGVSLRRLMGPFMGVGLCAVLLAALAQEFVGPHATRWMADFKKNRIGGDGGRSEIVKDFLYHTGTSHRQWVIAKFDKRQPNKLEGVRVIQERPDGSLMLERRATRAEWLDGHWWFEGLQEQKYTESGDQAGGLSPASDRPVEMADYQETPTAFLNEATQNTDFLSSWDIYSYLRTNPNLSGRGRARREVDLQARLAMPWTCVVMVLLSLPAAAGGVRRSALISALLGLAFLFGYYFFLQCGILLGKREILWPWLAGWLPNIVFLAIGGVMTARLK
jgi:lipopolysaccharide export system permease protein